MTAPTDSSPGVRSPSAPGEDPRCPRCRLPRASLAHRSGGHAFVVLPVAIPDEPDWMGALIDAQTAAGIPLEDQ